MCVIICCESKFPSKEILEDAESHNDHGAGVAWLTSRKEVKYVKGITGEDVIKMIEDKKLKLPCIIHFRLTSCGSICDQLTHPFPISENAETNLKGTTEAVLFHNGTWSSYNNYMLDAVFKMGFKIPSGKWSDSRAMAWLGYNYGIGYLHFIRGSRMAVLSKDGIEYFGGNWEYDTIDNVEQKEIVYSNLFWKRFVNNYQDKTWSSKHGKMLTKDELEKLDKEVSKGTAQIEDLSEKSATDILKKTSASNSHSTSYDKKVDNFMKEAIKEIKKQKEKDYGIDGIDIEELPLEDLTLKQVYDLEDRYIKRMAKYEMSVECLEFNKLESKQVKFVRKCEKKISKRKKQIAELDDRLADLYENTKLVKVFDLDENGRVKISREDYQEVYNESKSDLEMYNENNMYGYY